MRLLYGILRRTVFSVALLSILSCTVTAAQVVGQNKSPEDSGTYTMSVSSRLVIEAVTVKDKKGEPIKGLTAKDFTVTEDGAPQAIKIFEYQELPTAAEAPLNTTPDTNVTVYGRLSRSQIAAETPGDIRYRNKRLLALYFDMRAMPLPDQARALAAAKKFIREQMTTADLVCILRYEGSSVDVLQDFSDDRNRLLSILETLTVGEGQGETPSTQDDSTSDTGAAFGQDDSEFNIFTTDRQLAALQTAAQMLGRLSEKKSLIYFASGLRLNGIDNQAQLHATEDAAIRAGVSFWPIDARGLVASAPLGDATQGSPGGQAMYTGAAANAVSSNFQRSQDTLFALAGDTGGKALLDNNDLGKGIVNAQHAVSSYYILGYYTSNGALDGKFRKVKVSLNQALTADLDYRQGYYAGKEFGKFTTADKERQLEDALMLGDPITELTISMELNYFQLNRAEYYVPVMVKIPGRELALAKRRGAEHTLIDFIGEIKDIYGGSTVTNIRDHIDAPLVNVSAADLAKIPIEYYSGYTLLPGKYSIKILARDDETGRIGTFQTTFVIPNLNKEIKRVATSSVVLSGQRQPYHQAIYNATKGKDQAKQVAADPLVQNGQQLIPSVTRVFSRSRALFVYLQGYVPPPAAQQDSPSSTPAAGASSPPTATPSTPQALFAFVSLYRDEKKVYESDAIEATPLPNSRIGVTPISFSLDLKELPTGTYNCQVTVLNPSGQKATFWQSEILLNP